jgi:hypothetical protein
MTPNDIDNLRTALTELFELLLRDARRRYMNRESSRCRHTTDRARISKWLYENERKMIAEATLGLIPSLNAITDDPLFEPLNFDLKPHLRPATAT